MTPREQLTRSSKNKLKLWQMRKDGLGAQTFTPERIDLEIIRNVKRVLCMHDHVKHDEYITECLDCGAWISI